MTFPFEGKEYSFGQLENLIADENEPTRKKAFASLTKTFEKKADLFAHILNYLSGFRLCVYKKRGWTPIIKEALDNNRMKKETLDAMWKAISDFTPELKRFLECKSALLKKPKLDWHDLEAPIGTLKKKISYADACAFVVKHFSSFSPKMGAYATKALKEKWVDAEDRKNKMPGGFCVSLPCSRESRILMTYGETMTNVYTLAHELGHGFHNDVLFSLPPFLQDVKMNVAETASTMAEMVVTQAALSEAKTKEEKLFILDDQLSRATSYLMNIHARFLFETAFYEKRKEGFVTASVISSLMEKAQKEAYGDSLGLYHPLFWAAKMHFYFSDAAFYNFPYTFGYLFSLGIYEMGQKKDDFENTYISLLLDTGQMKVEDLAAKHLETDLTKPFFWEGGLSRLKQDINSYIELIK